MAAPASAIRVDRCSIKASSSVTRASVQFCRSAGGYYRLDTDDARVFLDDYVAVP
jgi:hypothetical protein